MEIILLEKVSNLGGPGDKVKVRSGYGRNYLVPTGKAVPATKENVDKFESRRADLERQATDVLAEAQVRAEKLQTIGTLIIRRKAGDEGKLFGSVGTGDIANALIEAGASVEKREVSLPEGPIRMLGEHAIDLHLHTDVTVQVLVAIEVE